MRRLLFVLAAVLGAACLAAGQQRPISPPPPADAASPASGSVSVEENVQYGEVNGQKLLLDVYQPAGNVSGLRPAVVLIHGGAWSSLDKSTMRGMGQFLARSGLVAFSVDYRLLQGSENRWPAQLDDVQRAVRWVRAHALKYHIQSERIGAFGHSAGAQLAALLGMQDTRDDSDPALVRYSSRVQAVVDVSGPTDFTLDRDDPDEDAFFANFLGADYSKHPEIWRDASPVFHASKTSAPFLIVHGTHDEDVPLAQAEELAKKLRHARVPVTLIKVDDVHTFQTPEARRRLAFETLAFFNRYLEVN